MALRELIVDALLMADISYGSLTWTEMRWDIPDITASWQTNGVNRNIHGWVLGSWGNYRAEFEGAVWQDDEDRLVRRVMFFPGPFAFLRTAGAAERPQISMFNIDIIKPLLKELVQRLAQSQLDVSDASLVYPLQPSPRVPSFDSEEAS